jgi:diguanylate cyclase (GGDEF)-like protein
MNGPSFESTLPKALTQAENLPSLPAVAVEVLRLCEDEDSTVKDLVSAVQRDPALAMRMLKLANSPLFGLGNAVATVDHAAMVLGLKTVKLMSLSFSLAQTLPREGTSGFDYARYWRRSLLGAVAARALARREEALWEDEAFLAGLIAHVGQLVLAECLPAMYIDVVAAEAPRWPSLAVEKSAMGFHSADVAGALLSTWNLPDVVAIPVAYAARLAELPAEARPDARRLTEVLAVALGIVAVLADEDNGAALLDLEERAARLCGMGADELEAFLLGLEGEVAEVAELLALELPDHGSHAGVLARARDQIVALGLRTAIHLQTVERRADDLEDQNRELAEKASTDALTGLANRAAFDAFLAAEIERRRTGAPGHALGLILLDLDRFKQFNDRHGHLAGDAVLEAVGGVLRRTTRKSDLAARYGGEEFAVVLANTSPVTLMRVAERIRTSIEACEIRHGDLDLRVTASLGGVCVAHVDVRCEAAHLIRAADKLLYRAKERGRNRSEVYSRSTLDARPEDER